MKQKSRAWYCSLCRIRVIRVGEKGVKVAVLEHRKQCPGAVFFIQNIRNEPKP